MKFSEFVAGGALRLDGLSSVESAVKKDANGLPFEWALMRIGNVSISKNGKRVEAPFTAEDAQQIEAYHKQKGTKIPIDCNHMLFQVAKAAGVTEDKIVDMTGEKSLAAGFCNLAKRDDGIYATDVTWVPLAGEMLKQGVWRHFSPVFREENGELRITSLALTNIPGIDKQEPLAASAENVSGLACAFKAAFGLSDKPDAVAMGALVGITEKLKGYDTMKSRVEALELSAENSKKEELIKEGISSGKLTNALLPWAQKVDALTLSGFLAGAAPVVAIGSSGVKPKQPDAVELSAEDKKICAQLNIPETEFLKTKKSTIKKEVV